MTTIHLSQPLKYDHPKGTPVTVVDRYTNKTSNEQIWFHAPKVHGIYYSKSIDFFNSAITLREKAFKSKGPVNPTDVEQGNAFIDNKSVFNFFTEACSGMILLFAAVESFANGLIEESSKSDYYKYLPVKISLRKFSISYKKRKKITIEQMLYLNIEEKLKKVLPTLYNFQPPSQEDFWQDFMKVKFLRDSFIHSTRDKSYGVHQGTNSIYAQLFDINFERLVSSIGDLLKYLESEVKGITGERK